jgi:thioredoxin reductase
MKNTDVVIIGAGPVGLFAGFYAGMRGLEAIIVDSLEMPGGQLSALYPEKYIYDIAGFDQIKAQDLVDNLLKQLSRFESTTTMSLSNPVLNVEKLDDGNFNVVTKNEIINTKSIIIAAGNGAFKPRTLGLENEDSFDNIHYFVNDMSKFSGRKVAIFGGGDSALDWSLMLKDIASEVHVIHRRDEFRAHEHTVDEVKKTDINIHTPFVPDQLVGETNVSKLIIRDAKTKELKEIEVDDVICNFGFISNLGPIKDWELALDGNRIIVDTFQKTSVDGIFAIGDICTYGGKTPMITNGFGEGPIAINSCYQKINPEAVIGTLHSSSVIGGGH